MLGALILAWVALPTSALAQSMVCCNQHIDVNGPWIGMDRSGNSSCIEQAQGSRKMRRRICRGLRRAGALCSELAPYCQDDRPEDDPEEQDWPEDAETTSPPGDPAARGGLDDGFDDPSEPTRPHPTAPPKRLVYLIFPPERADQSVFGFKSWLDGDGCALALQEAPEENAEQVVWGRLVRGAGGARVELRSRDLYERTVTAPAAIPVEGWNRSAIAAAIRQARERLGLLCRR